MLEENEHIPLTMAHQLRAFAFRLARLLDAGAVWIAVLTAGTVLLFVIRQKTSPPQQVTRAVPMEELPQPVEKTGADFFAAGDYATAMTCFADSAGQATAEEERLVAMVNRSMAFARLGRMERAMEDLKDADELVMRYPELQQWRDEIRLRLAQLCLLGDRPADAIKHLRGISRADTETLSLKTLACLRSGRPYDAVRGASALISRGITDSAAYINRAIAFAAVDRPELAAADLNRAAAVARQQPVISAAIRTALAVNDAQLALQQQDWSRLVTVCSVEIEHGDGAADLHRLRAVALAALGQQAAARIDWKLAAHLDPSTPEMAAAADTPGTFTTDEMVVPSPRWQDVDSGPFQIELRLVSPAPQSVAEEALGNKGVDRVSQARMLAEAGDAGTAIALLADHLAVVPADRDARVRRVAMLMDMGDLHEALRDLHLLASLDPGSPTIHTLTGLALARLEQQDEAVMSFSQVIRLQPDDPEGYFNRATAYFSQQAWSLAASDFQRALIRGDESAETVAWAAAALARSGQSGMAFRKFLAARETAPDNPLVHRLYVEWLLETDHPAALDELATAIDGCPTDRPLRQLRLERLLREEQFAAALVDARWLQAARPNDRHAATLVRKLETQTSGRLAD